MTLGDIRNECWDVARDTALVDQDRLWTKAEMNRYINRVYKVIARETRCIRDDITASICRIAVTPYADYAAMVAAAATDAYIAQDVAWFSDPTSWFYVNPDPAGTYAARLDEAAQTLTPYSFPMDARILDIDEIKWTQHHLLDRIPFY